MQKYVLCQVLVHDFHPVSIHSDRVKGRDAALRNIYKPLRLLFTP